MVAMGWEIEEMKLAMAWKWTGGWWMSMLNGPISLERYEIACWWMKAKHCNICFHNSH